MKKIYNILSFPLFLIIGMIVFISVYSRTNLSINIILTAAILISVFIFISGVIFKNHFLTFGSIFFLITIIYLYFRISEIEKNYASEVKIFNSVEKVIGYVCEFPENKGGKLDFKFNICGIKFNGDTDYSTVKPFTVLVKLKSPEINIKRADVLIIENKISFPRNNIFSFNYREYLFFQGIFGTISAGAENVFISKDRINLSFENKILKNTIWDFREKLLLKLKNNISPGVYEMILSIFFGIRSGIDEETYNEFKNTGMLHLLAISGMNISFIGGIFLVFFRLFFSKSISFIISIFFLFLYIIIILYSASSFRAFLMYAIQGAYFVSGLKTIGLTVLCYSGIIMIFINPFCIFDPGFQLSFLATSGILLFSKIFSGILPVYFPEKIKSLISVTLSAFISVFALQWALFHKIQFFSLVSSLFVVPIFETMFIFLFFSIALYYITGFYFAARIIEFPVVLFLKIIKYLDKIPCIDLPEIPLIFSYLMLPALFFLFYLIIPFIFRKINKIKKEGLIIDFEKKIT